MMFARTLLCNNIEKLCNDSERALLNSSRSTATNVDQQKFHLADDGTAEQGLQHSTRAEFLGNESAACSPLAGKKLCDLFLQREKLRDISTISRYRTTLHLMTKRGTRVHVELVRYNSVILQQYTNWKAWLLEPYRSFVASVPPLYLGNSAFASDSTVS
jgi:hypothetical protein